MIRKFISEFVGTILLVILGCGTMVACNQYITGLQMYPWMFNMLLVAVAFGLTMMVLFYTIGKVSGAHVNPAVSIAHLIDGRISIFECVYYVCAQVLGGLVGAFALTWIFGDFTSLGATGYDTLSLLGSKVSTVQIAIAIEAILTFVFVLVFLSATKKENQVSGMVVGLAYTLVHLMGIPFTGASVNPARSIGPAILTGGVALEQLWVFIVAPLAGGILAALFYKFVITDRTEVVSSNEEVAAILLDDEDEDDEEIIVEEVVEETKENKNSEKKNNKKNKSNKKR